MIIIDIIKLVVSIIIGIALLPIIWKEYHKILKKEIALKK